jgi:hypothetical protein
MMEVETSNEDLDVFVIDEYVRGLVEEKGTLKVTEIDADESYEPYEE